MRYRWMSGVFMTISFMRASGRNWPSRGHAPRSYGRAIRTEGRSRRTEGPWRRTEARSGRTEGRLLRNDPEQSAGIAIFEHPDRAVGRDGDVANAMGHAPALRRRRSALAVERHAVE